MLACNLSGVTLHARSDGPEAGPVLVLSNSLGTDLRIWDALLPLLPPEIRVIRYDKRGHGLSDCPDGAWGMQHHIADLEGLLDSLGVAGAAVCGVSVGGLIAQGLAARRPDLVGRLILCDTAARIGTAESWADRIAAIEQGGIAAMAGAILERATASLIEGCGFELIEDAGHLPCIEQPAAFATLLNGFLKETGYV